MELSSPTQPIRPGRIPVLIVGLVLCLVASACVGGDGDDEAADQLASADESPESDGSEGSDDGAGDGAVPESFFDGSVTVVVPNSPGTLSTQGRQRVMTALVGDGPNAFLGGPDLGVMIQYSFLDNSDGVDIDGTVEGDWLTTNASALGLYVSPFSFERAGLWQLTVLADGREVGRVLVEVVEESVVPNIGDPAPPSVSPTGSTVEEIAAFSTDPIPNPALYDLSLDEALANGLPTVVVFATPAFCRTALCGPTLETVKTVTAGRDDIDVVHIEPFDIEKAVGGSLEPIPAMDDWGLVTEPWVFVADADGLITAGFEGIIGQGEFEAALDQLSP